MKSLKESDMPTFECVLGGDLGTGKTSFLKRHTSGEFEENYTATLSVEGHPLIFHTNRGPLRFNVWDTSRQEAYGGLCSDYYLGDCALILFDVTLRMSYLNVAHWYHDLVTASDKILIVLCGNKVDIEDRQLSSHNISFHRKMNLKYFDLSVKRNYNLEKPFLWLARKLMGDPCLEFVAGMALTPPNVLPDKHWLRKMKKELRVLRSASLPEEDEDP